MKDEISCSFSSMFVGFKTFYESSKICLVPIRSIIDVVWFFYSELWKYPSIFRDSWHRDIRDNLDFFFFCMPEFHEFTSRWHVRNNGGNRLFYYFFLRLFYGLSCNIACVLALWIEPNSIIKNMWNRWNRWIVWRKIRKIDRTKKCFLVSWNWFFPWHPWWFWYDNICWVFSLLSLIDKKRKRVRCMIFLPELYPWFCVASIDGVTRMGSSDINKEVHD